MRGRSRGVERRPADDIPRSIRVFTVAVNESLSNLATLADNVIGWPLSGHSSSRK